jgi:hypothetical protein
MRMSERAVRQACRREHHEILRCCVEWDRQGECTPAIQSDLAHHSMVLRVLRDYLEREHHQRLHG